MSEEKRRILIVDDEEDVINVLRLVLSKSGYEVLTAPSGMEGLTLAQSERPDAILLDIMMKEMDGWEVLKLLKLDEPDTGEVNKECLKLELLKIVDHPGYYRAAVRFTCRPSAGAPSQLSLILDGERRSWTESFLDVRLFSDRYYKKNLVRYRSAEHKLPEGTYRVCYVYDGTEDDVWPAAADCEFFDV